MSGDSRPRDAADEPGVMPEPSREWQDAHRGWRERKPNGSDAADCLPFRWGASLSLGRVDGDPSHAFVADSRISALVRDSLRDRHQGVGTC